MRLFRIVASLGALAVVVHHVLRAREAESTLARHIRSDTYQRRRADAAERDLADALNDRDAALRLADEAVGSCLALAKSAAAIPDLARARESLLAELVRVTGDRDAQRAAADGYRVRLDEANGRAGAALAGESP